MYRHDVKYDAVFKELDGNGCSNLSLLLKKSSRVMCATPVFSEALNFRKKRRY
jgi:hypothetical protein